MRPHRTRRISSVAFALATTSLFACAIFWPVWAEGLFRSRLVVGLFAVWCGAVTVLLHPELYAGITLGFREFRKATRDVQDDIDRWL